MGVGPTSAWDQVNGIPLGSVAGDRPGGCWPNPPEPGRSCALGIGFCGANGKRSGRAGPKTEARPRERSGYAKGLRGTTTKSRETLAGPCRQPGIRSIFKDSLGEGSDTTPLDASPVRGKLGAGAMEAEMDRPCGEVRPKVGSESRGVRVPKVYRPQSDPPACAARNGQQIYRSSRPLCSSRRAVGRMPRANGSSFGQGRRGKPGRVPIPRHVVASPSLVRLGADKMVGAGGLPDRLCDTAPWLPQVRGGKPGGRPETRLHFRRAAEHRRWPPGPWHRSGPPKPLFCSCGRSCRNRDRS